MNQFTLKVLQDCSIYCAEHPRIVDDEFKTTIYEMARLKQSN